MDEFAGKVALVTGGARGIGRAVAALLVERGARVVLVGRDAGALEAAASALGTGAAWVSGDIAVPATGVRAVARAVETFGGLDVLANVAGVFPTARLEETTEALYGETLAANLAGTVWMCQAALPALRERRGAIVNVSSTAARFPTPGLAVYSAAKAGVEGFTRSLAAEAAPLVRVNAVSAGPTRTETVAALVEADTTGAVAAVSAALPLGRYAEPSEIAEAIAFLASPRASIITGQVLHANAGGLMA